MNGQDSIRVEVTVIDKPSPPEGPLNVSDIHADRVTLDWKEPLDNGGLDLDSYVLEKMDTTTGRWVPAGKVSADKTSAVVDGLVPGHDYKFRVSAVNAEGQSDPLETDQKVTAKEPFDPPGKTSKPNVDDYGKDFADLSWTPPLTNGGAELEG